jgi:hypothetical protein
MIYLMKRLPGLLAGIGIPGMKGLSGFAYSIIQLLNSIVMQTVRNIVLFTSAWVLLSSQGPRKETPAAAALRRARTRASKGKGGRKKGVRSEE